MIQAGKAHSELLSRSVVVSGVPRSGTTFVGRLIGSLEEFEYFFEPPTFFAICQAFEAGALSLEAARMLIQIHAAEELFLERIHGRAVNLRDADSSATLKTLDWRSLAERWASIDGHGAAVEFARAHGRRLAVKMPGVLGASELLRAAFPSSWQCVVLRDAYPTIESIIRRGWVSSEGLGEHLWPYVVPGGPQDPPVPAWVPAEDREAWGSFTEAERACLLWLVEAGKARQLLQGEAESVFVLRYEDVVADPRAAAATAANTLEANPGPLTDDWLRSVEDRANERRRSFSWLGNLGAVMRERFETLNAEFGYASQP